MKLVKPTDNFGYKKENYTIKIYHINVVCSLFDDLFFNKFILDLMN